MSSTQFSFSAPATEPVPSANFLSGKHIVLGMSGGIACYKGAELCRALVKAGASVQVVMTEAATEFMTAVTMQALSGRPVFTSQWDSRAAGGQDNNMAHINLSREAHAVVVAPASADFMAKLLHGRADELLSLMCLARPIASVPLIVAPAMNREMWQHPATQRNMAQLKADGTYVLDVGAGEQACGEVGDGRMLEPHELLAELQAFFTPKVLAGKRVCITAGPTYEAIDPVRGMTNRSSGKMGFALAQACANAGAEVCLVAGPVALDTPRGVSRVDVRSAQDMLSAVNMASQNCDVFIACAAVADWAPANAATQKLKKDGSGAVPTLSFVENPDILASVASSPAALAGRLYCVGFAAESHDLLAHAQAKRVRKGVPMLVGNIGPDTFGQDDNALVLITEQAPVATERADKLSLAHWLLSHIAPQLK
jgi:phosphopantothenoylcysteine decarboxylase/phosphopantothenate--cysteine ligase